MTTTSPMNEHEAALFEAITVLGRAIVEMGGHRGSIQAGLDHARDDLNDTGQLTGAATLDSLREAILRP